MTAKFTLDVTVLEPKRKHPTIFEHFDQLLPKESFIIHNDHDPKPLYYQLIAERGQCFNWTYLVSGPEIWQVSIQKRDNENTETIGQLSATDFRKAQVFKNFGLNFSCHGQKTIDEACAEKCIDPGKVKQALEKLPASEDIALNYNDWSLTLLISFIIHRHHLYVKTHLPELLQLSHNLSLNSSDAALKKIEQLTIILEKELSAHLHKEEVILFPYITALTRFEDNPESITSFGFSTINTPVNVMMTEHESADEIIAEIQNTLQQVQEPQHYNRQLDFYSESLKAFANDLDTHIHLENNILFPKAIALEKELLIRD